MLRNLDPLLEWDLVSQNRVDDVAKLSGYGHHGDPVALALAPLLVVEGAEAGVQPICPLGCKVERAPQVRRAVLRDRSAFQLELPGLVDRRVDAGAAHDGGGVFEPGDVSYLCYYLRARRGRYPRHREDQRFDRLEQHGYPRVRLGDAVKQELDLRDVGPDLE